MWAGWDEDTHGHIREVADESMQYNLSWTMLSSHFGAEFLSPGALLRETVEKAGLRLGS